MCLRHECSAVSRFFSERQLPERRAQIDGCEPLRLCELIQEFLMSVRQGIAVCDHALVDFESATALSEPSFFGTRRIGLDHCPEHGSTTSAATRFSTYWFTTSCSFSQTLIATCLRRRAPDVDDYWWCTHRLRVFTLS